VELREMGASGKRPARRHATWARPKLGRCTLTRPDPAAKIGGSRAAFADDRAPSLLRGRSGSIVFVPFLESRAGPGPAQHPRAEMPGGRRALVTAYSRVLELAFIGGLYDETRKRELAETQPLEIRRLSS